MHRVAHITNANQFSGVGNRAYQIEREIRSLGNSDIKMIQFMLDGQRALLSKQGRPVGSIKKWQGVLGSKSITWVRLGKKLRQYIRQTHTGDADKKPSFDLFHFTNQSLSFLTTKLHPSIITVHDIIELLEPQDAKAALLNKYLYHGIPRADHLITVSEYTRQQVQEYYGLPSERITVIPNGVSSIFHPIENFTETIGYQELRLELKLGDAYPIILYVGSEHPRKNVSTALQAFAKLREARPDAVFIKAGEPGLRVGREKTLQAVADFGIRDAIRLVGRVDEVKLNQLYNLADVFIFPSRMEGFGLPPLEAMAAGTPVVCSDASSLPEVVCNPVKSSQGADHGASAAIMHDPDDVESFAKSLLEVTADKKLAQLLHKKGLERARKFSWRKAAEQELRVYKKFV